jgi:hypothetical protein
VVGQIVQAGGKIPVVDEQMVSVFQLIQLANLVADSWPIKPPAVNLDAKTTAVDHYS